MSRIFDALRKAGDNKGGEFVEPVFASLEMDPLPTEHSVKVLPPATMTAIAELEPEPASARDFQRRPANVSAAAPIFPMDDIHPLATEQYRIIRTKLLQHPLQPHTIVISSPSSGDGKTVTAINTAACLALKAEANVLLIDADMRRSSVASLLGLPAGPGLSDILSGRCELLDAAVRMEQLPNLTVLPAGEEVVNPAELLDSRRWRTLIEECKTQFRYVIIDATPIAAVADYALVQTVCDGVIVVARPDHTDRRLLNRALSAVPKDQLIGVVLNCVENWFLWKTHGYGYYKGKRS